MSTLVQDLRYAARTLRKSPGFTAVTVLTLALGIGANTAIFSVVQAVLLRPLPYHEPQRLVYLWGRMDSTDSLKTSLAAPDVADYREQATLFEEIAATSRTDTATLGGEGGAEPEQVTTALVTTNFFSFLGVRPALGHAFGPEHGTPVDPNVPREQRPPDAVVLSHELWQRRFGGEPEVIGRTVPIHGQAHVVLGVLPPGFRLLAPPGVGIGAQIDLWRPLRMDFAAAGRDWQWLRLLGRLKPGVTLQQAQQQVDAITARQRERFPVYRSLNLHVRLHPLHDEAVAHVQPVLLVLLGAVGFVLLITCANVAGLLLARAAGRRAELCVRAALGASRGRLVRQFLTEALLLGLLGGAAGMGVAWWGLELLRALAPANVPRLDGVRLDLAVLGFALGASLLSALLVGLVPALQGACVDLAQELKDGVRSSESRGRARARRALVVGEVALSLVLLVGTGLMLRSLERLQDLRPGFDPAGVLHFDVSLPWMLYPDLPQRLLFYRRLREQLAALPGVTAAGGGTPLPLSGTFLTGAYAPEGAPPEALERNQADYRPAMPGYLEALGVRLLRGRSFTAEDVEPGRPAVVVVDQKLAARLWPGQDPVGRRLQVQDSNLETVLAEVVGVVEHVRHDSLQADGRPAVYLAHGLWGWMDLTMAVRSESDPQALAGPVRAAVRELDPQLALYGVRTLQRTVDDALAPLRFALTLIGLFAVLALGLAALGLYGVLASSVRQRTAELGIRMALGARQGQILGLVLGQGLGLVAVGLLLGLAAAAGLARLLQRWLYEVSPTDPAVYACVTLLILAVGVLACAAPARRASRVEPMRALRHD